MSEPETAAGQPGERQHDEVRPGYRGWWRCVPIEEAILREAQARAEALDEVAAKVKSIKLPGGSEWAVLAAIKSLREAGGS